MKNSRYSLNKNKYLLDDEFDRLTYLLNSFKKKDPRDCSLLYLALYTGARATELLNLTWEDLDLNSKTIYIRGIKGSNDRELPIYPWLFHMIEDLNQKSTRIYPISYPRLRQIWQHYRPTQKKFHSLRHTFAIRLYKKTKDIRLVQVALGHRSIANTMVYAEYVYTQQELKKLIL